ncbi:MAG: PDZ domain-containing protein [Candidatus Dormibacteria bacterium]
MDSDSTAPADAEAAPPALGARLGATVRTVSPEVRESTLLPYPGGVEVGAVDAGGSAGLAGLVPGDVIYELNGYSLRDREMLVLALGRRVPGDHLHLRVWRGGHSLEVDLRL